jgi:hypothetical protein
MGAPYGNTTNHAPLSFAGFMATRLQQKRGRMTDGQVRRESSFESRRTALF